MLESFKILMKSENLSKNVKYEKAYLRVVIQLLLGGPSAEQNLQLFVGMLGGQVHKFCIGLIEIECRLTACSFQIMLVLSNIETELELRVVAQPWVTQICIHTASNSN
jgi:hypothetical protein